MYFVQRYLSLNSISVPVHLVCYQCFSLQIWTMVQQTSVYMYLCIQTSVYMCVCMHVCNCSAQGYIHGSGIAE